jgi:uncharacterized membrane protein YfcA
MEMNSQMMKILGVVALVICLVCIFVAVERYNTNAKNVRAMNQMRQAVGMGNNLPGMQAQMKPAIPTATKYAGFFAVLFGAGGAVLLVVGLVLTKPSGRVEA